MRRSRTKMIVEAGAMIALAMALSFVKIFEAPYGGSVTAGSMIPIVFFAIRWGMGPGIMAGVVYGALQFIFGPKYSYHIVSILCDYVLAFGALGLAGLFRGNLKGVFAGTTLGIFGRFVLHVLSGVIVFASYAGDTNPWIYSILYNGAYLLPELIITLVIVSVLYKPLVKNLQENLR